MFGEKVQHLKGKETFFNSVKDISKIQVVDNVTGNLTTFQEQDQSEKLTAVNETAGALSFCSFISCSIGAVLYIDNTIVELTS